MVKSSVDISYAIYRLMVLLEMLAKVAEHWYLSFYCQIGGVSKVVQEYTMGSSEEEKGTKSEKSSSPAPPAVVGI